MNENCPRDRVAGADAARLGTRKGWAVVVLVNGRLDEIVFTPDLRPFVDATRLVAVDIPIGLPGDDGIRSDERGRRLADSETYGLVGPRRSSVFWAPPRNALLHSTYAEARQEFPSLSSQAYHLGARILQVAALVADHAPFVEFHPELSFRALGGQALDFPKKSWNGQDERQRILKDAGLKLPASLEGDAGLLAVDDLLDAAVGAVTARSLVADQGHAVGGTKNTSWQDRGVIWCPR